MMMPHVSACCDAALVDRERQVAQPRDAVGADDRAGLGLADVLVVAGLGLRRGREDRLGQPVGLAQALRAARCRRRRRSSGSPSSPSPTDSRARRTRPAAASVLRTSIERPREHVAMRLRGGGEVVDVRSTRDDAASDRAILLEPERRQLRQDLALVGNPRAEHVVERGDAIGGDDEQMLAEIVDVADLAARASVRPERLVSRTTDDDMAGFAKDREAYHFAFAITMSPRVFRSEIARERAPSERVREARSSDRRVLLGRQTEIVGVDRAAVASRPRRSRSPAGRRARAAAFRRLVSSVIGTAACAASPRLPRARHVDFHFAACGCSIVTRPPVAADVDRCRRGPARRRRRSSRRSRPGPAAGDRAARRCARRASGRARRR